MAGKGSKIAKKLRGSAGFYAAIAIACWSTVATAFKWALEGLTPASMLFIATTAAIATLFILLRAGGYRGDFFAIPWKAWKRSAKNAKQKPKSINKSKAVKQNQR